MVPGRWVWKVIETHSQSPTPQREEENIAGEDNVEVPQRNDGNVRRQEEEQGRHQERRDGRTEERGRSGRRGAKEVDHADNSHSEDDADNALGRGGDGDNDGEEALTVMANATNKKTVMEDDNAGTEAVTGAMRIPSEPKQTGTTPEVDQHHHLWDAIHLRKQRWRWERPFYSS